MFDKKIVSIIIPVYDEEKNIYQVCDETKIVFNKLKEKYDYEIIFIDDGSKDKSPEVIEGLADKNNNIRYIQLSRNFGKEIAVSAGLQNASGDAVVLIDSDFQHPPKFIPQFLEKWENGADVVVGMRENYKQTNFFRKFCSYIFYKVQNAISDIKIFPNETDYRLLDRRVVDEFNKFTEKGRIVRGLINWMGFERNYVYFSVPERKFNKAGYSFSKLAQLAFITFVSHSLFPLKLAGYLGIVITFFSGILGLFIFIENYLLGDPWNFNFTGTALLAILIMFLVGIILCCLGLIALYIANIHNEVVDRPLYVIKKKKNFNKNR